MIAASYLMENHYYYENVLPWQLACYMKIILYMLEWFSIVAGQDVGSMEYIRTLIGSQEFFAVVYM